MNLLDELAKDIDPGVFEDTVVVRKVSWKFRLLCDHERNWSNGYVRTSSVTTMLSSMRAPTLAIGIREIGRPDEAGTLKMLTVQDYFAEVWTKEQGTLDAATKRMLEQSNEFIRQYWFAEKLFQWLSDRDPEFIDELWRPWSQLEDKRTEFLKAKVPVVAPVISAT